MKRLFARLELSSSIFYENLKMAITTLHNHKLRSFLTMTGVVIGIINIMLISSVISGIDLAVKKEVESFGTRTINIYKFDLGFTDQSGREQRTRKPLTLEDSEALARLDSVETSVPFLNISAQVGKKRLSDQSGKILNPTTVYGTSPEVEKSNVDVLIEGRWFTKNENETKADVCVIGDQVKENYFSFRNPLGETLDIGGRKFRVIGVLQKRRQFLNADADQASNIIYIPIESTKRLKPQVDNLYIQVIAKEGQLIKALDDVRDLLRLRRNTSLSAPDNFSLSTADSLIEKFHEITVGIAAAMVGISSIGLFVGGIGVMNIMLVSVSERTHEIGLRKAIGAKRSDILIQFLVEASTLTGLGGITGLLIGWLLTFLVNLFMPSYVPLWAPVIGFATSVSIGIVFGLLPAWRAANLDPIEALRYE